MNFTLKSSKRLDDIMYIKQDKTYKESVPWFIEFYFPKQKKKAI